MKKTLLIAVIALALIIVLSASVFTVRENEYACTVRFSKIIDTTSEAGLHFKVPFVDSVKYFSKATKLYDIPPSEVLTSDKQNMTVDCYILWQISDPLRFYRAIASYAARSLRSQGKIYFEVNPRFASKVAQLLLSLGFVQVETIDDNFGRQRMVRGTLPCAR